MFDYLELTANDKYYISDKGKNFVLNPIRLKKQFTQVNKPLALCQVVCQQYNLTGNFVSDEYMKKICFMTKNCKICDVWGNKEF